MKLKLTLLTTFFSIIFSFGQTVTRNKNETKEMFANRFKPDSTEITHTVIETNQIDPTKNVLLAFYRKTIHKIIKTETYTDHNDYEVIIGTMFIPVSDNKYERIEIDTFFPDGGEPQITSVFFANANKDKDKELIVLVDLPQRHYDYSGTFYETYIYHYNKKEMKFEFLKKLSESFLDSDCSYRDGRVDKVKYNTAKAIKARLKKLGF